MSTKKRLFDHVIDSEWSELVDDKKGKLQESKILKSNLKQDSKTKSETQKQKKVTIKEVSKSKQTKVIEKPIKKRKSKDLKQKVIIEIQKQDEIQYASKQTLELKSFESQEKILKPNPKRFVLHPIQYPKLWDHYKSMETVNWGFAELNFTSDRKNFESLNPFAQDLILHVLAYFNASDGIVNENLALNFYNEIQIPESRACIGTQIFQEVVHSETYSQTLRIYIQLLLSCEKKIKSKDSSSSIATTNPSIQNISNYEKDSDNVLIDSEKSNSQILNEKIELLMNAIVDIPAIKDKANLALKWTDKTRASFHERLVAFAMIEGIHFQPSFAVIFYFRKQGIVLDGLMVGNKLISRDENRHFTLAVLNYEQLENKLSNETFYTMLQDFVNYEIAYAKFLLPNPSPLFGMNQDLMIEWIKYVADFVCDQFGYEKFYKATNPFDFMDELGMASSHNFFETETAAYRKTTSTGFSFDENFD